MFWIPVLLAAVLLFALEFFTSQKWLRVVILAALSAITMGIIIGIDYVAQTTDTEVWSGYIEDWKHKEEWNEWIPGETVCTKHSDGTKTCHKEPGHWEHHYAENYLKTTDNGWFRIYYTPDDRRMNDSYPNRTSELEEMFKKGTPTASSHTYRNKVQASNSIFKHDNIDLDNYKDLPEYPDETHDELYIDRIVGNVPNKKEALRQLAKENTKLNKMIDDPDNPGEKRSWKQVNIIFVNVGANKSRDYGFALQEKWENGNKNDFIVSFSMNKNGKINWVYPFSWSESEMLKIKTRDDLMKMKKINDFTPVVKHVSELTEKHFTRKEFKDFDYLSVQPSGLSLIFIWVFSFIYVGIGVFLNRKYS